MALENLQGQSVTFTFSFLYTRHEMIHSFSPFLHTRQDIMYLISCLCDQALSYLRVIIGLSQGETLVLINITIAPYFVLSLLLKAIYI